VADGSGGTHIPAQKCDGEQYTRCDCLITRLAASLWFAMRFNLLPLRLVNRRSGDSVTIPELGLRTPREALKNTTKATFRPTIQYPPTLALQTSHHSAVVVV
jgi:hypothetical protein